MKLSYGYISSDILLIFIGFNLWSNENYVKLMCKNGIWWRSCECRTRRLLDWNRELETEEGFALIPHVLVS